MRVLIVEDEKEIARQVAAALGRAGYVVDVAHDGEQGHFLGDTETYDVIILDLGLPGMSGLSVLESWRESGHKMPVMILSARGSWQEKVSGELLAASMQADKAAWVTGWQQHMPGWASAIVGLLLGLVDALRGVIRPVATVLFSVMLWNIYLDLTEIVGGFNALPADQALAIYLRVVNAIILLATTCVSWWFGSRLMRKT